MADNRINIVISAKDEGTAVVKRFGNSLDDASSKGSAFGASLSRIKDVALGVYLPQIGMKLLELGKNALTSTGNFEQSRVAFETMLGSADKAQTMLTQISQFAKETPFDLPGVVDASKQLLAYGFAQDDVLPTMRKLGDVAAGVSVPIGQLTAVYGQVRVAGKLMGQDLLQFTQAGVPLLDYLAQTMHKTAAQIKDDMAGGVGPTFANVQTALEAMTAEGSKFGGLMDKQSHTFQGVMSNIGDSFGQIGRAALGMDTAGNIVKASFFDRIKDAATAVMPALQNFATGVGPAVQDRLNKLVDLGTRVGSYLMPAVKAVADAVSNDLAPAIKKIVTSQFAKYVGGTLVVALNVGLRAIAAVTSVVSSFVSQMSKATGILIGITAGVVAYNVVVGGMTLATKAWAAAQLILNTALSLNPLGLIIGLVGGVAAAYMAASAQSDATTHATDRLADARRGLVDATNSAKFAEDALRGAQLDQEGASLRVETAQRSYNEAVAQYGPNSLEARQASYDLQRAQDDLAKSTDNVRQMTDGARVAQENLVKAKDTVIQANKDTGQSASDAANNYKTLADRVNSAAEAYKKNDMKAVVNATFSVPTVGAKHAVGTNFAPGGSTLVGEHGPEVLNLPAGSKVTTAWQTASQGSSGGDTYATTISGNIYNQSAEAVDQFFNRIDKTQRLARMGIAG